MNKQYFAYTKERTKMSLSSLKTFIAYFVTMLHNLNLVKLTITLHPKFKRMYCQIVQLLHAKLIRAN